MSRISKAKHQLYLQEWAAKISECQNSGLHITEWCSQHNIDTHAYYYWLKQLREETLDHIPELANINFPAVKADAVPSNITSADNITFKKLEVQTPLPNTQAAVIVHLPSATIYGILETVKANGLNVYTYLNYILERMPNMNWAVNPEVLEALMPWND